MPVRCKSIAGLKVTLVSGDRIIPGCELIYGSAFINGEKVDSTYQGGTEEFPPLFFDEDELRRPLLDLDDLPLLSGV